MFFFAPIGSYTAQIKISLKSQKSISNIHKFETRIHTSRIKTTKSNYFCMDSDLQLVQYSMH
jgi:hypothetical protein